MRGKQRLPLEDRRHFGRLESVGNVLAALATPGAKPGSQGSFASAPYQAYLREIFPGITYIHILFPCRWIADFEVKYPGVQIWLERIGGPDHRDPKFGPYMDPRNFLQLDVPNELFRKLKSATTAR